MQPAANEADACRLHGYMQQVAHLSARPSAAGWHGALNRPRAPETILNIQPALETGLQCWRAT